MNLSMQIRANYIAGLPILAQLEKLSNEKLIATLKTNLAHCESPLVSQILEKGIVKHFDGEIAIHLVENQFPFLLVDACHIYLCDKNLQEQIKLTAQISI